MLISPPSLTPLFNSLRWGNREQLPSPNSSVWHPDGAEAVTINSWFNSLAEGSASVTGAAIVPFLMKSGVPKEALREIWELGDVEKKGYVTQPQFTLMIRLVSLSLAGLARGESGMPSMEAYYASVGDVLPLPSLYLEEEQQQHFAFLATM